MYKKIFSLWESYGSPKGGRWGDPKNSFLPGIMGGDPIFLGFLGFLWDEGWGTFWDFVGFFPLAPAQGGTPIPENTVL